MKSQTLSYRSPATSSVRAMLMALPVVMPVLVSPPAFATGGWVPDRWLDEGGKSLRESPEFFWDIELTRLAKENAEKNLPFKLKLSPPEADREADEKAPKEPSSTVRSDISDFEDALKTGRLKPADKAAALKAHTEMRTWLEGDDSAEAPKSVEMASEFADYHRGASHFAHKNLPEAKAAWEKLLQRPAEERHYRSVWAAYMLGKTCMLDEKTRKEAVAWFEKCRQFAREGFADSEGLAADSYGWQARAEYDAGDYPASARHYLQQLALGDTSAINSLKLLVPDRDLNDSFTSLSFATFPAKEDADPNATEPQKSEAQLKAATEKAAKQLMADVKDPVLRQIITAHILATTGGSEGTDQSRLHGWLEMINKAKLDHVEGAASLGWAAYMEANYAEAAKWAKLDKPATPLGQWLQAKLALRNGDFAGAAAIMKSVLPGLPDDGAATRYEEGYLPKASAAADLGASLLAQGQFTESLAAFWNGGCWADAAYVAERVLTTPELVQFVKANAMLTDKERGEKPEGEDEAKDLHRQMKDQLMNLAGRRLIREGNSAEGRLLLNPSIRESFDHYLALGTTGDNLEKPNKERAKAWFNAAQLLRDEGSSWRGTEDDVQREEWGGYAPSGRDELVKSRLTGKVAPQDEDGGDDTGTKGKKAAKTVPIFVPSTPTERKRLEQNHAVPMNQFVKFASSLAVKAAGLLPDNTEELADVLNQAGRWIQDLDNPGADKIYFQIEKRCKKTTIGAAVIAKHWFIEPDGPWTSDPDPAEPKTGDPAPSGEPPLPEKK